MFSSITGLLKGSFDESLKKLFQPAALIPAAVFILLNLLFIIPPLNARRVPLPANLSKPDDPFAIALSLALLVVLAYLLLSFSSTIEGLMSGDALDRSSGVGRFLYGIQLRRMNELRVQAGLGEVAEGEVPPELRQPARDEAVLEARAEAAPPMTSPGSGPDEGQGDITGATPEKVKERASEQSLMRQFPRNPAYLAPTALGNALVASAYQVFDRHGIDMSALWSHMEQVLPNDKLIQRLNDDRATLGALVNLSFVIALFGLESALLNTWLLEWPSVFFSLVALPIAYLVYRAAVAQAQSWGDGVKMAFDLHREELRAKLNVREFESRAREKERWTQVSRWLLWGGDERDIFESPPPPPPSSIAAATPADIEARVVQVTKRRTPAIVRPNAGEAVVQLSSIDYVFALSNPGPAARQALLVVRDPSVARIDTRPVAHVPALGGSTAEATVMPTGLAAPAHKLLWTVNPIPAGSAVALAYSVPARTLRLVAGPSWLKIIEAEIDLPQGDQNPLCRFTLQAGEAGPATLDVRDPALPRRHTTLPRGSLRRGDGSVNLISPQALLAAPGYHWQLGPLAAGETVELTYHGHGGETQ